MAVRPATTESPERRFEIRGTGVRWVVLALVAFAAASAYLTRWCISAANTTIQADLGFNDTQMGWILAAFGLGYLLFQVPGGWLGMRLGTRVAFALIGAVWSLCNLWSSAVVLLIPMWLSRFGLGVFQAGLTPITATILKDWMPLRQRGMSSAVIAASMSIGGAFTMLATGWLLELGWSWRTVFAGYAAVGVFWAAGFYRYFRTSPAEHGGVSQRELRLIRGEDALDVPKSAPVARGGQTPLPPAGDPGPAGHVGEGDRDARLWTTVLSANMLGLCVQSFFRAAGYAFFVTWFFAYLEYAYGIDKGRAGLLNSLPLLAVVLGTMVGGTSVDGLLRATRSKRISRSGTAFVALAASGVLTTAAAWTSSATELSAVIAMGAFFAGIGNPAAWAATIDVGGRHTAVAMGIMNMAGCLAGVVMPILLGSWFATIKQTGGDWSQVIYLHAGFYFAAAIAWSIVRPD